MINKKTKSGFTLLEVLIASTIFAVSMLLVTGVVSQGGTFYTKLKSQRTVNEEIRKLTDQLTQDIRESNGDITLNTSGGTTWYGIDNFSKTGIMAFNCIKDGTYACSIMNSVTNHSKPNVLVFSNQDGIKIYWFIVADAVYYNEYKKSDLIDGKINGLNLNKLLDKQVSSSWGDSKLIAGSTTVLNSTNNQIKTNIVITDMFTPFSADAIQKQPYISFEINSTYGNVDDVNINTSSTIRTTVTSRNYSQ